MAMTTITSREFNQDVSKAKRRSLGGPVVITDRGRPAHVLLTIETYQAMAGCRPSIVNMLAMPQGNEDDVEFEPARLDGELFEPAKLS